MRPLIVVALALLSSPSVITGAPTLDGETSLPLERSALYRFECPDGSIGELQFDQKRGGYPILTNLTYSGRSLSATARDPINAALREFRALESLSPRCRNGGGVQMLLGGLRRDKIPARRTGITVSVDANGRVSIN